jgi:hypothetical protein
MHLNALLLRVVTGRPRAAAAICLVVAVLASRAQAQESAPALKEREAPPVEVERGLYFRGSGGAFFLNSLPATQGPKPFSSGQMAQVELGIDIGEHVAVGLFVMGTSNRAGSDYIGHSGGTASGDFSGLVPGAAVRLSLVGISDANDVKRTWFYLRAGGGYAKFYPSALVPADALVFAGPGIEYFTRIRHFSVGFEVTGSYLVNAKTFGFALAPNLRYAF